MNGPIEETGPTFNVMGTDEADLTYISFINADPTRPLKVTVHGIPQDPVHIDAAAGILVLRPYISDSGIEVAQP
jgi:hypothetical protein